MANPNQRPVLPNKHLNRGLFSDYYLDEIVPTSSEFQSNTLFASVKAIRDELLERLDNLTPEELDEAQLEDRWIKPVLEALGHHWSVQVKIRYREKGFRKPDYAFADTPEAANALRNEIYTPDMLQDVLAIGDAKKWGVRLDQSSGRDERNPSQQIDEYLRYSEVTWGILTDGRYWRLYERSTSKDNTFYAVDLESLLRYGEVEDFYYFYLFFRREAFAPTGWLEQVLSGSVDYAESLSDQLEDEVYNALELIAQGFLAFRRNRLKADDPETLRVIYEESLVFLYRLLFIFYAESRDILPMSDNPAYAEGQSLSAIKKEIAEQIDFHPTRLARLVDDDTMYARLSTLFFNIDVGSEQYDITAYNGRLFSDEEHPFLADKRVGGTYLGKAIDRLARVPDKNDRDGRKRVFVDYRDLDVRHLGAIYERLLEYQLDVAHEPLTVKSRSKREIYETAGDGDEVVKDVGDVLLRTGSNERKVTGSDYTPDYIVTFIVENTLAPLLTEITERYADLDDAGQWNVRDPQSLRDAILAVNVLDPATGSGHFMVEVVNYMAKWLTDLNLLPADIARDEEELTYWKRQVVTACVYGVDVNPLAVELARLSLWLATISRDRPLSFLDHHVRLGNTLVGARLDQLTPATDSDTNGQLPLWDVSAFSETVRDAVGRMMTIEGTIAEVVTDVKAQEKSFAAIFDDLEPWRKLAHVWTAQHFGLDVSADQWSALYTAITTDTTLSPDLQTLLDEALRLHEEYHFFHWELAFPEVFFDENGDPIPEGGFDAVVGNPPYVRQERISPYKPFFEANYAIYSGTADLFLYFYERGLELLRDDHRVGYITSGTFMNSNSAKSFRQYIHEYAAFEQVINFGENQPFKGAEMVYPMIAVLRSGEPNEVFQSLFIDGALPFAELPQAATQPLLDTASDVTALDEWRFQPVQLTRLFEKIISGRRTLTQVTNGRIYSGIKTGLSAVFIIDSETRNRLISEHDSSREILVPFLRGADLRPWYQLDSGSYLVATKKGIDIDKYPAILNYMKPNYEALSARSEPASGTCEWYELRPFSYDDEFNQPKIIWPDIQKLPRFSWDETGIYNNDKGFIVIPQSRSLLAILNSRVLWFILTQLATPLRLRGGLWQYQSKIQFVERLPIPELTSTQEQQLADYAEQITALAQQRYQLHEKLRSYLSERYGDNREISSRASLYEWWEYATANDICDAIESYFRTTINDNNRFSFRDLFDTQLAEHTNLTQQIIALETQLNAVVYEAFDLTPDEIALIEEATKYPYGAV
ncbi:MAG: Eco57I restriction-modification methylase domain-containing protein [Chloroflexota bacterium]